MIPAGGKARGVRAPFAMLGAALIWLAAAGNASCAELALPRVINLPAPGTYALQRIQQVPEAILLDAAGKPAPLSAYARGAVTALGFFYGHCADPLGCPVAWSTFEAVRKEAQSDPLLASRLRLVFVSLDPAHDTPATMRLLEAAEKGGTDAPWSFLTGRSEQELAPLLRAMGQNIGYEINEAGARTGAINHMLKVFLIDPDGWVREIYSTAFLTPESLLSDARTLAMAFPDASNHLRER